MAKLTGKKMKMTQLFKDGKMFGVTPVQFDEKTDLSVLKDGMRIQISGTSKGRGFAGVVKRWNFRGGPKTHGQKNRHRAPGSIGNTTPQRVIPGRHMAGRMGMDRVTYRGMLVASVDMDKRVAMINGAVPGTIGRKVEFFT